MAAHRIVEIVWNGVRGADSEWHWVCSCGREEWNKTHRSAREEFAFHKQAKAAPAACPTCPGPGMGVCAACGRIW